MQKGKSFAQGKWVRLAKRVLSTESASEPASTCQGSHCETDPRPKPKRTKVSGKAGAAV